jgi:hypothetical protein
MTIFLVSLMAFGLAMLAMAVGVLTGRTRIRGSCGGIAADCDGEDKLSCSFCPNKRRTHAPEVG